MILYSDNIIKFVNGISYSCPFCSLRFKKSELLFLHIDTNHEDELPEDTSAKKYVYDLKHPGDHLCQICKSNKCVWKEKTGRYSTICQEPMCKEEARRRFLENYKKKNNKDHDISDPEQQREMAKRKKNSGEYKFQDGGRLPFVSSYEEDFLKFCDLSLDMESSFIEECALNFNYKYEGKSHFYLPDYYIRAYDLIIEIKAEDQVSHPKILAVDKEMEALKDESVRKSGKYNYIKIYDKKYDDFVALLEILKNNHLTGKEGDRYIIIPERSETIRGFKMPDLDFLYDKKLLIKSDYMKIVWEKTNTGRFDLIIARDSLPKDLQSDSVFNDGTTNIDFGNDFVQCRTAEVNIDDDNKVERCFREFKNYYTKRYEKFINPDYMSVLLYLNKKDFLIINIKWILEAKKDDLFDLLLKDIMNNSSNFLVIKNNIGYDVIIRKDTFKLKFDAVKKICSDIDKNKGFFAKKATKNVIFDGDFITPPGTMACSTKVSVDEKYSIIEG